VNVAILRVFVALRRLLSDNAALAKKLDALDRKVIGHDAAIRSLFDAIRQLMAPPKKPKREIGFDTVAKGAPRQAAQELLTPQAPASLAGGVIESESKRMSENAVRTGCKPLDCGGLPLLSVPRLAEGRGTSGAETPRARQGSPTPKRRQAAAVHSLAALTRRSPRGIKRSLDAL
jgi:hypothetical protein